MQLWNVTVGNAKRRVSSSSKVSAGWNKRAWSNAELVVIEVVAGMVVVLEHHVASQGREEIEKLVMV